MSPKTNGIINEIHVNGMVLKSPHEISNKLNLFFITAPLTLSGFAGTKLDL